jgi:hypothetical protein
LSPVCYTTTLRQTFSNSSKEVIPQARYTFPLYDGVAVSGYTITYGDTTLRGVVQQKDVAKKTYEAAVDRGETAGLLESLPAGVFGVTLGNLPPDTDVHVKIIYCGELKHDAEIDGLRFTLPTSIAPRYGDYPGELMRSTAASDSGISIVVDVNMSKSAIRKLQSPSHPIAVSMGAISSDAAQETFTPSKASTTLTLGTTELADDFIVQLLIDDISKPQALVERHPDLHTRALMATLVPKFNLATSHPEIVFIADQSGSMGGSKNDALISALMVFVKSLPLGVRFNIIAFGSSFKPLWPRSQAYTEANMKAAIDFIDTFNAGYGGTELLLPVKAAFEQSLGDMPLEVMLLTDGEIWGEQTLFDYINMQITENGANARVFALGIGNDVSHTLIEGVARAGHGFAQFVGAGEGTDQKVVRMLKGALYPHLTNRTVEVRYNISETVRDDDFELVEKVDYCVSIKDSSHAPSPASATGTTEKPMSFFDTSADLDKSIQPAGIDRYAHLPTFDTPKILQAPSEVPSLFPFNRTTIYMILGEGAPQEPVSSIILRATSPQGPMELTIDVNEKEVVGTTIHQLAAKTAIQELEEGRGWLQSAKTSTGLLIKREHESRFDELVEREAVRLGESFQVAGKWTSFVAVSADGSSRVDEKPEPSTHDGSSIRRQQASRSRYAPSQTHYRLSTHAGPPPPVPGTRDRYAPSAGGFGSAVFGSASTSPAGGFFRSAAFSPASAAPLPPVPGYAASRYAPSAGGSGSALFGSASAVPPPPVPGYTAALNMGSSLFGSASAAPAGAVGSAKFGSASVNPTGASRSASSTSTHTGAAMSHGPGIGLQQQYSMAPVGPNSMPSPFRVNTGASSAPSKKKKSAVVLGFGLFADDDDAPAAVKATPSTSPLHSLIGLQTFSGAWAWSDDLLAVILPKEKKLQFDATFGSEQIMATSLAVAYMEARLTDSKDVWEMVVEKARTWMGSQVDGDANAVDNLVEKAKSLL